MVGFNQAEAWQKQALSASLLEMLSFTFVAP
jgi:hypothetical protein